MFEKLHRSVLFAVASTALGAGTASGDIIGIGFESGEGYTTGNINGQPGTNNWSKTGAYDVEVTSSTSNGGARSGSNALRISNAVTSGSFGDQAFSPSLADAAGEPGALGGGFSGGTLQSEFTATWYFKPFVDAVQPGLSAVVSPDRGDGARMSWVRMYEDATSGLSVSFTDYDTNRAAGSEFGTEQLLVGNLSRDQYHRIDLTMSFIDGSDNDVVRVYVDGVLEATGKSWEDYFRENQNPPFTDAPTVDSLLFRVGGTSAPGTAGAGLFIDDVSFASSVPEPTGVALLGLGVGAMLLRRRVRRTVA